eukprot:1151325-Pelagomonas_calceolata.AAC.2
MLAVSGTSRQLYANVLRTLLQDWCLHNNKIERKKAYAGRNQCALRKDPTFSAVTDHESHQYLN